MGQGRGTGNLSPAASRDFCGRFKKISRQWIPAQRSGQSSRDDGRLLSPYFRGNAGPLSGPEDLWLARGRVFRGGCRQGGSLRGPQQSLQAGEKTSQRIFQTATL